MQCAMQFAARMVATKTRKSLTRGRLRAPFEMTMVVLAQERTVQPATAAPQACRVRAVLR